MNIRELLEKQAQKNPDKVFLFFEQEKITYRNFDLTANRIANAFKRMGVRKGEMVAIMLPNSPEFLYAWMALNKIGAVEVPINIDLREREIEYILRHSEASGLLIHENLYPIYGKIQRDNLPYLRNVIYCGHRKPPPGTTSFWSLLSERSDLDDFAISEEDPAVCIYTSGTTDRPKGVINSHKSWILTGQAYAHTVGIGPSDRVMTSNPLFHANAQVYPTMGALAAGASLVLLSRFSSSQILEQAQYYDATTLVVVQAVTPWIWNRPQREDDGDNPITTMVAGNVPTEIYYDFERRFQLKIQTIYSLTESVFAVMGPREGTLERKPGGVGVPMEHPDPSICNEVKIVDDMGSEVSSGTKGEIIIRNPAIMIGYFKDPKKTAETKKDGWIHTGDIGYQDKDGYFFFVGRKKEVIRRRGELISPAELESVISGHRSVAECAAIGVPSELGSGEEEIKAYVRLKAGENVEFEELVAWCDTRLAEFKIPRYFEFRDDFPRSAIGRIQKNLLRQEKENLAEGCFDRMKTHDGCQEMQKKG